MSVSLPRWMRESLDLSPYAAKLQDPRGKFRWDAARVEAAIQGYREFLYEAALADPGKRVRPTLDVDEVWHLHILDTMRYGSDCNRLFGRFIHHVPSAVTRTCDSNVLATATCDSNTTPTCSSDGSTRLATCDTKAKEFATCDSNLDPEVVRKETTSPATCHRVMGPPELAAV